MAGARVLPGLLPNSNFMTDLLATVAAILITLAFCALLVRVEVKEDERREKIEAIKSQRLKYFLDKCAESRRNERN